MKPQIETINYDYKSDEMECLIKPYFLGEIFHCATKEDFDSILENNYIDYTKRHSGSFGYKQKAVCLCDYRKLDRRNKFYKYISGYIYRKYIFILKKDEYKNIIPVKTEDEFDKTKEEGHLIPYFECWYSGILTLDKIKKIYYLNVYNRPENEKIIDLIGDYLFS